MENVTKGRKKANRESWKSSNRKKRRLQGEQYESIVKSNPDTLKLREARSLKHRCNCDRCGDDEVNKKCHLLSDEERQEIFTKFWQVATWDARKAYVAAHTTVENHEKNSRKKNSIKYFLTNTQNFRIQVCKVMFINTLCIGEYSAVTWAKGSSCGITKPPVLQLRSKKMEDQHLHLIDFLTNLPKQESHYCRKNTSKLFIQGDFGSISNLYKNYSEHCKDTKYTPLCKTTFQLALKSENLSLFIPRKDLCDSCNEFKVGSKSPALHEAHQLRKRQANDEKTKDKEAAGRGEIVMLTMDVQSQKTSPASRVSSMFFKTKLIVHNFTVYNCGNNHCKNYFFTECDSDLCASTFVSCIVDYLVTFCVQALVPIVIWSDNCGYQNKNVALSNALMFLSRDYKIEITQKYLERGHTQLEADSVHACIERQLKNTYRVNLPEDYIEITKRARSNPQPYEAVLLDHTFFQNYAIKEGQLYSSIRPGSKKGDPTVAQLVALKYDNLKLHFKIAFTDEWTTVTKKNKNIPTATPPYPKLHSERLGITPTKFQHLQALKLTLEEKYRPFYDNLPVK